MSNHTVYNLVIQSPLVLISGSVIQHHTEPQVGSVRKHLRKESRMQVGGVADLRVSEKVSPGPEHRAEVRSDVPGLKNERTSVWLQICMFVPLIWSLGGGEMPHGWSVLW